MGERITYYFRTISQIAEVRGGYTFRTKIDISDHGDTHIVQIKDVRQIQECENRTCLFGADFPTITWQGKSADYLSRGSVLLPARGDYFIASYFDDEVATVASSQFFILTPKASILPEYLCWVLNQSITQHQIGQMSLGSNIKMLHASSIKQIKVPVPDISKQQSIIYLHRAWQREQRLTSALLANRAKQIQGIYQQLLTH